MAATTTAIATTAITTYEVTSIALPTFWCPIPFHSLICYLFCSTFCYQFLSRVQHTVVLICHTLLTPLTHPLNILSYPHNHPRIVPCLCQQTTAYSLGTWTVVVWVYLVVFLMVWVYLMVWVWAYLMVWVVEAWIIYQITGLRPNRRLIGQPGR